MFFDSSIVILLIPLFYLIILLIYIFIVPLYENGLVYLKFIEIVNG